MPTRFKKSAETGTCKNRVFVGWAFVTVITGVCYVTSVTRVNRALDAGKAKNRRRWYFRSICRPVLSEQNELMKATLFMIAAIAWMLFRAMQLYPSVQHLLAEVSK